MVVIRSRTGDFDYVLTFTSPASVSKDTETGDIKMVGGSITYRDNGDPDIALFVLDRNTASIWIEELFAVELKVKGTGEVLYSPRFNGRCTKPDITPTTVTILCEGDLSRFRDRFSTERYFYDVLIDNALYEIKSGTPKYVDLYAAKRPINPLIQVKYLDAINYMFPVADAGWYTLNPAGALCAGQTFYVTRAQTIKTVRLKLAKSTGGTDFDYRVSITGTQVDASGKLVPDDGNVLTQSTVLDGTGLVDWVTPDWDRTEDVEMQWGYELEAYVKYGIVLKYYNHVTGTLIVRVDTSNPPVTFGRGWAALKNGTWVAQPTRSLWFWVFGDTDDFYRTLVEGAEYTVDYINKNILFSYPDEFDPLVHTEMIKATYFAGYPTIDDIVTELHDNYVSNFTDINTITPTTNLNIRPFRVKGSTILSLLQELLKLGPWSMIMYRNATPSYAFAFVDSFVPSDWGSAPFTGDYATRRTFYWGGESAPPDGTLKIIHDTRRMVGSEKVSVISALNPDAGLLVSIVEPSLKSDYGRIGHPTAIIKSADSLDELVSTIEYLFQYHSQQIVRGTVMADKVSMKAGDAMFTNCNSLIYIKDTRLGYDGAYKLTKIMLNLYDWSFSLDVTNSRPKMTIDRFIQDGGYLLPAIEPSFMDQNAFTAPKAKLEVRGDWGLTRKTIGLDDTTQTYNAGYDYRIGVGDSDAIGIFMANELARVDCEVNESTGKIHTLDTDGSGSDDYRVAIAVFDRDSFAAGQSWPLDIKEVGLYNGATLLKRFRFTTPWPASPAVYDYFLPFLVMSNADKVFVCFVITA